MQGIMKTNIANVLDMDAYRCSRADDALTVELSEAIAGLLDLDLDTHAPQSKTQALIHLLEARDLLSR